nr:molybdenum cofactor guanylyltransferase [Aureimonas jatrophae]
MVLAGGRGARMNAERPKPLLALGDRSLLVRAIERLQPQVDEIVVSVASSLEQVDPRWTFVADAGGSFHGPLNGVVSTARHVEATKGLSSFLLMTAAADTPFFPRDVVASLSARVPPDGVAVASHRTNWIPTFALWTSEAIAQIDDAPERSLRSAIGVVPHVVVDFPDMDDAPDGDPFFNINTPSDIERARHHVAVYGNR